MRELHLFAGAGGGILGGMLLGHTCVCAVEIEPYRRKVLLQRQRDGILPQFPIWDDVRTFDGRPWRGKVDCVCAGIPCQKVSVAGDGETFLGTDYYAAFQRIICEIRPSTIYLENSPMLTSRGLGGLLGFLASVGYNGKWGVLSAGFLGACHNRPRIWILAFDAMQDRIERHRTGFDLSKVRPWGACSSKHLQSALEKPINRSDGIPQPLLCRMDDGLANRVDRLEAIGDGQIPSVAALAWRTLSAM